jgi:hypothetical protein
VTILRTLWGGQSWGALRDLPAVSRPMPAQRLVHTAKAPPGGGPFWGGLWECRLGGALWALQDRLAGLPRNPGYPWSGTLWVGWPRGLTLLPAPAGVNPAYARASRCPLVAPPRCSFARPSRTSICRPSTTFSFKAAIARSASAAGISTNAKPRERPVSRSVISLRLRTAPCGSNRDRIEATVVAESRLPTKMFFNVISLCTTEAGNRGRTFVWPPCWPLELFLPDPGPGRMRAPIRGPRNRSTSKTRHGGSFRGRCTAPGSPRGR